MQALCYIGQCSVEHGPSPLSLYRVCKAKFSLQTNPSVVHGQSAPDYHKVYLSKILFRNTTGLLHLFNKSPPKLDFIVRYTCLHCGLYILQISNEVGKEHILYCW